MEQNLPPMTMKTLAADVLVLGGGIAGCMAAISAARLGVKTLLVDKGNTRRSGCAATGIDHFLSYIPEIHQSRGYTIEHFIEDMIAEAHGFADRALIRTLALNSCHRVLDWERFGISIRDEDGKIRLVGKIGRETTHVHLAGRDIKVKLTKAALDQGVTIINRVMATDLIVSGGCVVGAVGIDVKKEEMTTFLANSLVLATGEASRLYRNTSGLPFNTENAPTNTGDGMAMAYRAGASMVNMEYPCIHSGPKNFHRCGRGSYHPGGTVTNGKGRLLGQAEKGFVDRKAYDLSSLRQVVEKGKGPLYMDCSNASENDIRYIRWALSNEGNTAYLDYLDKEGVSLKKHRLEFEVYEPRISGRCGSGIEINSEAKSSLEGLFAAGDVAGGMRRGGASAAATFGWIAGEYAARRAAKMDNPTMKCDIWVQFDAIMRLYENFLSRKRGYRWKDVQIAVQNVMSDYAFKYVSSTSLRAGLARLESIRTQSLHRMKAENPHELMRCLEVLNLIDVGKMSMSAALERRESRDNFQRIDFPQTRNDKELKFLLIKKTDGKVVYSTKSLGD